MAFLYGILGAAGILLFLTGSTAWRIYRYVLTRSGYVPRNGSEPEADTETAEWAAAHAGADWFLDAPDGMRLRAYTFPAERETHAWAVLVHGHRSNAQVAFAWARKFHEQGYHVLAVDCRAHGRSDGEQVGMGWLDRRDLIGWLGQITDRDEAATIVLYGVSMGAATVMMATGEPDLPDGVVACVEDCGFTSVAAILKYRIRRVTHLPGALFLPFIRIFIRSKHGSDHAIVHGSSVDQLRNSRIPTLFVHGDEDRYVPFQMLHELYVAHPGVKEEYVIPGARHAASSEIDPEYWNKVLSFINRLKPESAE